MLVELVFLGAGAFLAGAFLGAGAAFFAAAGLAFGAAAFVVVALVDFAAGFFVAAAFAAGFFVAAGFFAGAALLAEPFAGALALAGALAGLGSGLFCQPDYYRSTQPRKVRAHSYLLGGRALSRTLSLRRQLHAPGKT